MKIFKGLQPPKSSLRELASGGVISEELTSTKELGTSEANIKPIEARKDPIQNPSFPPALAEDSSGLMNSEPTKKPILGLEPTIGLEGEDFLPLKTPLKGITLIDISFAY